MSRQRECSIQDLDPNIANECRKYIPLDEKVLLCYEWDESGFLSRKAMVCIITEKQFVFVSNLYGGLTLRSLPLPDIYTVHEGRSRPYFPPYQVQVNDSEFHFKDKKDADRFTAALREAMQQAKGTRYAAQASSPKGAEERFRALVRLHNDGLITDEEFQQKRKEIVGEL